MSKLPAIEERVEPQGEWLDKSSLEAQALLAEFDPETLEPKKLADLRKRLRSSSRKNPTSGQVGSSDPGAIPS